MTIMRTLILMRHAKSDWKIPGLADHDRPLNARGRRATPLIADQLRGHELRADVILASSALRVQQTLELLQERWSSDAEVFNKEALYLAPPQEIVCHVEELPAEHSTAMVIGHNPGMCALVCHLAGEGIEMPTAAVAVFRTQAESWVSAMADGQWQLDAFWKPRELEAQFD